MDDRVAFKRIRKNIIGYFCNPTGEPGEILSAMRADGSFSDIDYETQNWTRWGPHLHAVRLKELCAIHAAEENSRYHSAEIAAAVHKGLRFLLDGNFRSDNWWMNDIGLPMECGLIRLLFGLELEAEEAAAVLRISKGNPNRPMGFDFHAPVQPDALRPYEGCGTHMMGTVRHTHIQLAAENGDPLLAMQKIRACVRAVNIELQTICYPAGRSFSHLYADEHSIKSDYSYHEHENTMLQNTYGKGMIEQLGDLFLFWRGSGVTLEERALRELTNLLLDGYALLRFRGAAPMMTLGRDAASADKKFYHCEEYSQAVIIICDALLSQGFHYRADEIKNWRNMTANPGTSGHFTRTKYFWQSDLLSHNRPRYQFTVHGVSNRMKRPESILKKNIQGMFLGDGSYNLMQTGYEYEGLPPYMDWRRVPGTTADCGAAELNPECEIDTTLDTLRIFGGAHGTTTFVGGVADDEYGFFAMDYDHLGVKAKKAWFCFDEGVVCLGAGISAEQDEGVFTTVDQRNARGSVSVGGQTAKQGEQILDNCKYVLSDSTGYLFLRPAERVYLANERRAGAWNRVDRDSGTDETVSGQVFLLAVDHGKHPINAEYAYMLLPCIGESELKKYAEKPKLAVLENSRFCQAVWHNGTKQLQAVFYQAGSVRADGILLTVDQPCAVLLRFGTDGWRLWVSNPEHKGARICVSLSGTVEKEVWFELREGYRFNNSGRPSGYDSKEGFLPYRGAQGDETDD